LASINKAILVGNVGKDPECGTAPNSGNRFANFSIATGEKWTDKATGEKREKTEWHRIVVWGPLAEVVEKYVRKGSRLYVEGRIVTREYEKDGSKRYATEIVLQGFGAQLLLLNTKDGSFVREEPDGPGAGYHSPAANGGKGFDKPVDDEIPF
jgi:single-strand DNA-binding protein